MKPSLIWDILNVPTQEELLRKFSSKESLSLDVALRLNPEFKNTTRVVIQEIVPIGVTGIRRIGKSLPQMAMRYI